MNSILIQIVIIEAVIIALLIALLIRAYRKKKIDLRFKDFEIGIREDKIKENEKKI